MPEPLASLEDLEARMGPIADETAAEAALGDASALVRAEAPAFDWAGEIPEAVVVVVLSSAGRALRNPDGDQAESIGSYSVTHGRTLGGVWLTVNERRTVRRATGVGGGLGSIELESPWETSVFTVPVDLGGDEMPWATLGEGEV